MRKKDKFLLVLVVFIAFVLRISFLSHYPPSLNWDEVSHGYNAYSILKTGQDEWGQLFPLANFRAYGDYPLPLNLYLTIPFIKTIGINEFAIRLPHALLGILTVISSYFLVLGVTKRVNLGLLAAFFIAVEPWHLFLSRFVLQSNLSVFFTITALALFFNRERNKLFLPLSILFLSLTLFSYHSTRIFSPLLLAAIFAIYRQELFNFFKKEKVVGALSLFFISIFFLSILVLLTKPEARARSNWVFLINDSAIGEIVKNRQESKLDPTVARILYNRPVYFLKEASVRYLEYFSPQFLFIKGGTQYQFSIPGEGVLYLVNMPFFYIGLFLLFKYSLKGKKEYQLLLSWLVIAPIPASITQEHFAVVRSTTMLPLPMFLTSLGLVKIYSFFLNSRFQILNFKPILLAAYFLLMFASAENYIFKYFTDYRLNYSWSWQYGYEHAVKFVKSRYEDYDKVIVTKKYGEPHEFFLFYWPWDPAKYVTDPNLIRFYQDNWYWVDRFDKFYFVNDWDVPKDGTAGWRMESGREIPIDGPTLLVTSPGNYPEGWDKLKTIYFLDGEIAFEILEKI